MHLDAELAARAAALRSPPEIAHRDEAARLKVEAIVRCRWRGASVSVFGSAATGLRTGTSSDIDLCVTLPGHMRAVEEAREAHRNALALLTAVEADARDVAQAVADHDAAAKSERRAANLAREAGDRVEKWQRKHAAHLAEADDDAAQLAKAVANLGVAEAPTLGASAPPAAGGGRRARRRGAPLEASDIAAALSAAEAELATARSDEAAAAECRRAARLIVDAQPEAAERLRQARMEVESALAMGARNTKIVFPVVGMLRDAGYENVEPCVRARTAVVRCRDSELGVDCDVRRPRPHLSPLLFATRAADPRRDQPRDRRGHVRTARQVVVNNGVALHNSALLRAYAEIEPRFFQLALLVKGWAAARGGPPAL